MIVPSTHLSSFVHFKYSSYCLFFDILFIASVGKLTFTYKNDQTTTDGAEHTRTVEKSISVKVKPKKCACISVTFQSIYYTRQFTLEATTKENKVIKAVGTIKGERLSNFQAHTKMIDNGPNAKCPHET